MKPVFHPFFGKQNELRKTITSQGREIARQAECIRELEAQLTLEKQQVKHMDAGQDKALASKDEQIEQLTREHKQLQENHTDLTTRYTTLIASYESLEAERDEWKAKASHKKRPIKEQINHVAQS